MKSKIIVVFILLSLTLAYIIQTKSKIDGLAEVQNKPLLSILPSYKVVDLEGNQFTLEQFYTTSKNHLFVHFWGTWCGPCEVEFSHLKPFLESFKDSKYQFLLVALNDDQKSVKKFFDKIGYPPKHVKILIEDGNQYLEKFGSSKAPETFIFGPGKEALRHFVGPQDWQDEYMSNLFKNHI